MHSELLFGTFPNYGFVNTKVPIDIYDVVKNETESFPPIKVNNELAGHIEHEYRLANCKNTLEPFLQYVCREYEKTWGKDADSKNWRLGDIWVNYQKKHEFNPPHHHDGSYSFVIFIQIPFYIKDELDNNSVKDSNLPRPGNFSFSYTNIFGEICNSDIEIDKKDEGRLLLFPSKQVHQVFPFYTSDEFRITVAGNLYEV